MGSAYLDRDVGEDATTVYVRGVLKVIKHPKRGSRDQFEGFTEYRVIGTVEE
jgi:hypothetical protein